MTHVQLSERQLEVAELVVLGLSNKAIASRLQISSGRVKQIVFRICQHVPGDGYGRMKIIAWWYSRERAA